MKSKRLLLDRGIAPIIQDQLTAENLEFDTVTIKKGMLKSLVEHGDYSALILRSKTSVSLDVLEAAGKNLQVIGIVGDSLENINITDASRLGILIKAAEYVNAYEIASLSLQLMVMLLSQSFQDREKKNACAIIKNQDILSHELSGFELAGTTVGLIGCGKVAQSLAMQIKPYCKRIIGYDSNPRRVYENFHRRNPLERPVIEYVQLREVLACSDIISIHTMGSEKVFKGKELYFAKQRPIIINTSRSGHVDTDSLLAALKEKRISGAAMTLPAGQIKSGEFEKQYKSFLQMQNVLIAPAPGKPMPENKKKRVRKLAQAVIDYLENNDLSLAVNPMDIFSANKKLNFPISRSRNQGAIPLIIGH